MIYLDQLRQTVPAFPDAVRTDAPDFRLEDVYAYVRGYLPETDSLLVRLDPPGDWPGWTDVPEEDREQAEFETYVPRAGAAAVSLGSGWRDPLPDPRPALAAADLLAAERAREDRVASLAEEMRAGRRPRLRMPELDRSVQERACGIRAPRRRRSVETLEELAVREAAEVRAWGSGRP